MSIYTRSPSRRPIRPSPGRWFLPRCAETLPLRRLLTAPISSSFAPLTIRLLGREIHRGEEIGCPVGIEVRADRGKHHVAAVARTRLDRGPHDHDRISLGGGSLRSIARARRRVGSAQGRRNRHSRDRQCGRGHAGDLAHSDRFHHGRRPGRQQAGGVAGAAGRQCHRPS
jgi:hypothetical protein